MLVQALICALLSAVLAINSRQYYVRAEEINWNYMPLGYDACHDTLATAPSAETGFRKAVYRGYTSDTFQDPVAQPESRGLFGPLIHAEVGDVIDVTFENALPFPVNLEPTGVEYVKPGPVPPGNRTKYQWRVPNQVDARSPDPTFWLYRSTIDQIASVNAGLLGGIVVSHGAGNHVDIDEEVVLILQVFNEASSLFYDSNLQTHPGLDPDATDYDEQSALHYTINGVKFCNLPGLNAILGTRLRWYVGAVGNEVDLHTLHWHGMALDYQGSHMDAIHLQAYSTAVLDNVADVEGSWWIHCHVNSHLSHGMDALMHVYRSNDSSNSTLIRYDGDGDRDVHGHLNDDDGHTARLRVSAASDDDRDLDVSLDPWRPADGNMSHAGGGGSGVQRMYYIGVVQRGWNYAPHGHDACGASPSAFTEEQRVFVAPGPRRIGSTYQKAMYVEFTDASFTTEKVRDAGWQHLGLLGPLMHAEEGDTLVVTVKNMLCCFNVSLHPHGVRYTKANEGTLYNDGTSGADKLDDAIAPNQTYVYHWEARDRAGPGALDGSSMIWLYHGHVDEAADTNAGLIGGIVVTARGQANPDGTPKDVDREVMLMFSVMNEGVSFMLDTNINTYLPALSSSQELAAQLLDDEEFQESNLMHSINGYVYCNLPGLNWQVGERVRLYVAALGDVVDLHTPQTWFGTMRGPGKDVQDTVKLLPGTMYTYNIQPGYADNFTFGCNVNDHIIAGMTAKAQVLAAIDAPLTPDHTPQNERTYYIAAEEMMWDYAPDKRDSCSNSSFNEEQQVYTTDSPTGLGSRYLKMLYREYLDANFSSKAPRQGVSGVTGPLIQAEVGDVVLVVLRNRARYTLNLRPGGGLTPLNAAARNVDRQGVATGDTVAYRWLVPESAGPGPLQPSTVNYVYTSTLDQPSHSNAGLVGQIAVHRKGTLVTRPSGAPRPKGVSAQVPLLFTVMNENMSPFLKQNIQLSARRSNSNAKKLQALADGGDEGFEESNLLHAINGFIYCNMPMLRLPANTTVRLLIAGMGSENDMHSPVVEGQVLVQAGQPIVAPAIMPAVARVMDFNVTGKPGDVWQIYCAVTDHIAAGMIMQFQVV